MFKFLTPGAKIIKISSSIITIGTLAVLAAVITTLALSSFTAEAQGDPGAVANLQLTSTSAGELTVSWDAASPTPTDYRVDWAKSTERLPSHGRSTKDTSIRLATATSTTITGPRTRHRVQNSTFVLATTEANTKASHGADHGQKQPSPWPDNRRRPVQQPEPVKEEPVQQQPRDDPDPPAGTIETLTAADDTGQLLLTWTAPAAPNADPTDYHVNWAEEHRGLPSPTQPQKPATTIQPKLRLR